MKKRIVTAVITACLALCAAVWPHGNAVEETPVPAARHKGGTTRPNTNARRSCPENGCCDNGRKEKNGNATGRAGQGAWRRSCPRTGRADVCGRNAAAGACAFHTAADHRAAARR